MKLIPLIFSIFFIQCFELSYASTSNVPAPHTVALTFDDGPNPIFTPQILAILKKNNIKATFFVVGNNARKYPDLIKAIHADGHTIASHSQSHPLLTKLSLQKLEYEITEPNRIIKSILGLEPKCLRYPFGASNSLVRERIRAHNMLPTSMGFNSFDYERRGTEKLIHWVTSNIQEKRVFLFHDGFDKREQTVSALPEIITAIKKQKLEFSAICS